MMTFRRRVVLRYASATLTAGLVCGAPLQAQPADPPAVVDAPADQYAPGIMDRRPNAPMGPGGDADIPFFKPLNDQELDDALTFAQENMPNFYRLWRRFPQERQRRLPPRIQLGFRLMFDARRNNDQRLCDVLVSQMKLRDEFIGLMRDLRRNPDLRSAVDKKVREIVAMGIKQRELRIENMEKMLQAEKTRLEREKQNPDMLVEGQFRKLENETRQFMMAARRFAPAPPGIVGASPPTSQPATSGE